MPGPKFGNCLGQFCLAQSAWMQHEKKTHICASQLSASKPIAHDQRSNEALALEERTSRVSLQKGDAS